MSDPLAVVLGGRGGGGKEKNKESNDVGEEPVMRSGLYIYNDRTAFIELLHAKPRFP